MGTNRPAKAVVKRRYAEIKKLAEKIEKKCQDEVNKLGFDEGTVNLKSPAEASYHLEKDPASGEYSLIGDWLDKRGFKQGSLIFHADGSFYVEQDVIKTHPKRKKWFVEAINAWGRGNVIKAEARLLPMPE